MTVEKEMISGIKKGDTKAFSLLVDKYQKLIFHVIRKMIREEEDVEDVCQEVFVKIYRSIDSFSYRSKLSTWIARIAYLTSINYLKKRNSSFTQSLPENIEDYSLNGDNPEEILNKKSISEYLNTLITKLPEHYRLVLTLYHLEEFSIEEIKGITSMPEGTIKNYLFRGRKLLKDKVKKYYISN